MGYWSNLAEASVRYAWVDDDHVRFHLVVINKDFAGIQGVTAQLAFFGRDAFDPVLAFSVIAQWNTAEEKCIVVKKIFKDQHINIQIFAQNFGSL